MVQNSLTNSSAVYDNYTLRSLIIPEGMNAIFRYSYPTNVHLPGSNFVIRETLTDPKEPNSSLLYYCQTVPNVDERQRATIDLIVHILREPSFSQLRTKEQLG